MSRDERLRPAYVIALEHSRAEGKARLVVASIASSARSDGRAWAGLGSYAHRARMNKRTVQRYIEKLKDDGELEVEYKAGPHGCNIITLLSVLRGVDAQVGTERAEGAISDTPPVDNTLSTYTDTQGVHEHGLGVSTSGVQEDARGQNDGGTWPERPGDVDKTARHVDALCVTRRPIEDHVEDQYRRPAARMPEKVGKEEREPDLAALLRRHGVDPEHAEATTLVDEHGESSVRFAIGLLSGEADILGAARTYLSERVAGTSAITAARRARSR
jgi:hypothetical protein